MAKKIFDQDGLKSVKARRLNEAFAGCETWTLAPPRRTRAQTPPPSAKRPDLSAPPG